MVRLGYVENTDRGDCRVVTNQADASPGPATGVQGWRAVVLVVVLGGLWLLLSGFFHPLLLGLGVASVAFCAVGAWRLGILDDEGQPFQHLWRSLRYAPWLLLEIIKANVDVAKVTLTPSLPIHPVLFPTRTSQDSDLGQVIYANSITLTPGTTSIDLEPDSILVHALTEAGAEGVESGEMDRRVTWLIGG